MGSSHAALKTVGPVSATLPITYHWQATDQTAFTVTTGLSTTTVFTWITPGTKTITVTANTEPENTVLSILGKIDAPANANSALPSAGAPLAMAALFWDDLLPGQDDGQRRRHQPPCAEPDRV